MLAQYCAYESRKICQQMKINPSIHKELQTNKEQEQKQGSTISHSPFKQHTNTRNILHTFKKIILIPNHDEQTAFTTNKRPK